MDYLMQGCNGIERRRKYEKMETISKERIESVFTREMGEGTLSIILRSEEISQQVKKEDLSIADTKTTKYVEKVSTYKGGGGTFTVIIKSEHIPPQVGLDNLFFTLDALIEQAKNEFKLL